jgi:pimeloyl-ACP methyl ester carboxylesterase
MAQLSLGQVFGMQWVDPKLWHRFLFSPEMPWEEIKPYLPRLSQESMSAAFELMMRHCPRPRSGQFPPMLVLGGTDDAFVPELALRQTARAYEADLEILPKVPHVMMLDSTCWREVAEMLAAWLKEKKF